ncbi:EPT1 [Cordylochernes scorpioides]|uniref:EPT1 n=1 Tax=Cordylochernes scorpioides TaxID=51811 RepID=A0ABY6KJB7_9ARAC|nr:EPT1 [Cordylochernes scorpioides]
MPVTCLFLLTYTWVLTSPVDITETAPRVLFTLIGTLFSNIAVNGIDGKHARQTNTSGPLGELMDHGIDSWAALFMSCCFYSIFGRADYSFSPFRVFLLIWSVNVCFYLSHWEKYNTGILYLPWGYDFSQVNIVDVGKR